ncbi:MAG: LytTR family transcriptional regulator DNA-binding domain-containing protein [Paludibacter sp.]|nr:LytTR family transcriptional regulator DNA-binding domain-containing protein [Paludibacter sp.]
MIEIKSAALIVFFMIFVGTCIFVNFAVNVFFHYSNFTQQTEFQQIINTAALTVISLIFVFGLSAGSIFLFFSKDIFDDILKILPLEILIYLPVFTLIIFRNKVDIQKITAAEVPKTEISQSSVAPAEKISQISVKSGSNVHIIQLNEIFYIQADGDYVQIHTAEKKYLKEQTMKFFEECLPANIFIRVHRSYIVNIEHIARIEKFGKDTQTLTLKNGEKIRASLGGYRILKEKLGL